MTQQVINAISKLLKKKQEKPLQTLAASCPTGQTGQGPLLDGCRGGQ